MSSEQAALLDRLLLPPALSNRPAPEQAEFLSKVLRDEVSPAGITALKKQGRFGRLRDVFPDDADRWAQRAGVKAEDCIAFRMERNGVRAEVVLIEQAGQYRVIRCNNVRQMAEIM